MRTIIRFSLGLMRNKLLQITAVLICGALFSGCETVNSLFSSTGLTGSANSTSTPVAQSVPSTTAPQRSKISVAPVVGPPDETSRALQSKVSASLQAQNISVANQFTDPSEYTLRGYVVAAKDKSSAKLSYIWDITDPSGKRINRITGEEAAALAGGSNDVWSGVTPQIIDKISTKTVSSVVAWLPSQNQLAGSSPQAGVASPANPSSPFGTSPTSSSQPVSNSLPTGKEGTSAPIAAPASPAQTTGSIGRPGAVQASVPQISGAPGDGSVALSAAIQRELTNNGILVSASDPKSYLIAGVVTVGSPKDGKQSVTIDWNVQDPSGKKLGTVSQKNEVPQGSLDGPWGKTADAAASAAAQGIIKLLPKTN